MKFAPLALLLLLASQACGTPHSDASAALAADVTYGIACVESTSHQEIDLPKNGIATIESKRISETLELVCGSMTPAPELFTCSVVGVAGNEATRLATASAMMGDASPSAAPYLDLSVHVDGGSPRITCGAWVKKP